VDYDVIFWLELEVGDIEGPDRVHRRDDGPVALIAAPLGPQLLADLTQGS
jgi:hypothetical protein